VPDGHLSTLAEVTMREMTVYGVSFDLVGKQPIVLLKTADGDKVLPVWIGHPEAASILMKLQGQEPPRPQTHDLLADVIGQLDAEVVRVTVTELRESTFHASITLRRNGDEIDVDSRTSDAIALALRAGAKIFAADDVIEESGVVFEGDAAEIESRMPATSLADLDPDEFRKFLDTVSAEEFAKTLEEDEAAESDEEDEEDEEEDEEDDES
jgi:bifunctional DNase/RNase